MNVNDCEVYYVSDLKEFGKQCDGTPYIGEVFFVEVQDPRGNRWRHRISHPGVRVERDEDGDYFVDVRESARSICNHLIKRIVAKGSISLHRWEETSPEYGSAAYIAYGQADDFAREMAER